MSLFDKFELLAQSRRALASDCPPPVATPFDRVLSATRGVINGQEVLLAGTNNYLGLTFHPQVIEKAKTALEELGSGTTGSRMANGSYASHHELEAELAAAFGWSSAMVFSTGYQANVGIMSSVVGTGEYLLIDADSHASIYDGCRMSKAQTLTFRHNDPDNLDRKLERLGADAKKTLVVVEGLYSMLGDQPPLQEFVDVKNKHGAWLLVDEAHSFGVFGDKGLGLTEATGLLDEVDFAVGTFSKSLAASVVSASVPMPNSTYCDWPVAPISLLHHPHLLWWLQRVKRCPWFCPANTCDNNLKRIWNASTTAPRPLDYSWGAKFLDRSRL